MFRAWAAALLLLTGAAPAGEPLPKLFEAWLSSFNSGDPAAIKAFHAKYLDDPNPMFVLESAQDTCGLTLVRVEEQTPTAITALLRERCLPGLQRVKIEAAAEGGKLKSLDLTPLASPGPGALGAAALDQQGSGDPQTDHARHADVPCLGRQDVHRDLRASAG